MTEIQYTPDDMQAIHLAIGRQLAEHNRHVSRMLDDLKPRLAAVEDAFESAAREWIARYDVRIASMAKKERRHYLRLHNPPPRRRAKR